MKEFINKLIGALDTHTKTAFSARKLSAFVVVILIIITHAKWFKSDHWEHLDSVLALDYGFISLCLGMTTYEAIKNKKLSTDEEAKQS
jgi:hypothetical protein